MCPPGVDQTCRSQQRWQLLAPKLQEQLDLSADFQHPKRYGTSPQHFMLGDFTWDAFERLVTKSVRHHDSHTLLTKVLSASRVHGQSVLENLPPELLTMIIESPHLDKKDVLALALCSQTLWSIVVDYIKHREAQELWAGTPLILTGTYLTDFAPAIHNIFPDLRVQEAEWLKRSRGRGSYGGGMCPARRWNWGAVSEYEDVTSPKQDWLDSLDALSSTSQVGTTALAHLRQDLNETLRPVWAKGNDTVTDWVLRNLTTHEYIALKRDHRYKVEKMYFHVKGSPWLSLDKALVLRICWGDVPGNNCSIARGGWAGHRFDVVPCVEAEWNGEWADVTMEILREAKAFKKCTA